MRDLLGGKERETSGRGFWTGLMVVALLGSAGLAPAAAAGRRALSGHVPEAVSALTPTGRLDPARQIRLAIGLPTPKPAELAQFLEDLQNPLHPGYRRYLTPEQFTERFGPTAADYEAVKQFARTNGLAVVGVYPNRMVLDVAGAVADVERTFQVHLQTYQHPTEARSFFSPDVEPSVEAGLPVLDVAGLSDHELPRFTASRRARSSSASPQAGGGPGGSFKAADIRAAYAPGVSLTGAGQSLGLVEFDGFYTNDIAKYRTLCGLKNVPLKTVLLNGYNGVPSTGTNSGNLEVALDIDMAMVLAPGLSQIIVYEVGQSGGVGTDILSQIASDGTASQVSSSWTYGSIPFATVDQLLEQMAAQGQSFFNSSGDGDANLSVAQIPSDSPHLTSVGGTILRTAAPGGARTSETVWNSGSGTGSTGGVSTRYLTPSWQQGVSMSANGGSATHRNYPDVAAVGQNVVIYADNGSEIEVDGTSISSPLWASLTALVNQKAAESGQPPVGFLNPALYALAKGTNYAANFHDVTLGNNARTGTGTKFTAAVGYDLCTGWGTPQAAALIDSLYYSQPLAVFPAGRIVASGPAGGPLALSTPSLTLTNGTSTNISWALGGVPAWLDIPSTGGTLTNGEAIILPLGIDPTAGAYLVGQYSAELVITNLSSGAVRSAPLSLVVSDPLGVTPASGFSATGPVGGPFTLTPSSLTLTNTSTNLLAWSLGGLPSWLNASVISGVLTNGLAAAPVELSLDASARSLSAGVYTVTLGVTNVSGGSVQTRLATLNVGQSLVRNGGFETGDFSSWTLTGPQASGYNLVEGSGAILPHSGNYAAALGQNLSQTGGAADLTQTLSTVPGASYLLSFWWESVLYTNTSTVPNQFTVSWAGTSIYTTSNVPAFDWTLKQFVVRAAGTSTKLDFNFSNDPSDLGLDDVSVYAIPNPAILSLSLGAQGVSFSWATQAGVYYQVQYTADLSSGAWTDLGSPTVATLNTLSYTDPLGSDSQRFYRVSVQQ